jgi:ectoine hydroxylase-related dioxygenase (phytanoyl-CoA dioxygenase family)
MPLCEPIEFRPGDATVHTMFTVHGTAANDTASPRWGLIAAYIPEDSVYTGGYPRSLSMLAKRAAASIAPGDPFRGMLPKVYG